MRYFSFEISVTCHSPSYELAHEFSTNMKLKMLCRSLPQSNESETRLYEFSNEFEDYRRCCMISSIHHSCICILQLSTDHFPVASMKLKIIIFSFQRINVENFEWDAIWIVAMKNTISTISHTCCWYCSLFCD